MLIKNYDGVLVNGSMGRIVRFIDIQSYYKSIQDADRKPETSVEQGDSKEDPSKGSKVRWPVVDFLVPTGRIEIMVTPERWAVQLPNGEVQASRIQVCGSFFHIPP